METLIFKNTHSESVQQLQYDPSAPHMFHLPVMKQIGVSDHSTDFY